jgi:hypothetical protein
VLARGAYARARDAVWDFFASLRLPYYFWLGARGFAGAALWLVVPVSMLAVSSRLRPGAGVLMGFAGGALLALVLVHLPFLQARFAEQNRLGAMFEPAALRRRFGRAPLAFLVALGFTLAAALPLYLLKIEIVPREAAWLPSVLFVVSIFPARLLAGWAMARSALRALRARRRGAQAHLAAHRGRPRERRDRRPLGAVPAVSSTRADRGRRGARHQLQAGGRRRLSRPRGRDRARPLRRLPGDPGLGHAGARDRLAHGPRGGRRWA